MGHADLRTTMTSDEFLRWDETQTIRHEFVDGEVFAMAGGEDWNATMAGNVYMALRQHLSGTPCRAYMSDVKVRVERANAYFYPDVFVTCDATDHASRLIKHHPTLVVEVLSPSTAAYDQGGNFARYRLSDSLQEYAVIDIEARRSDVHRKGADGLWVLHSFEGEQALHLASMELTIPADRLYADIDPPSA